MIHLPWTARPLRMVWRVERDGRRSHIVGAAHFFPHSFGRPLTRLIRPVNTVLTEGPLDEASSTAIAEYGRTGDNDLLTRLDPAAARRIERLLRDRQDGVAWLIPPAGLACLEVYTQGVRPWAAFFSIWNAVLGWRYSVDTEGYQIARKLGKRIGCLETLEEQLAVLDSIPLERIVRQLNDVARWEAYTREYVRLFLAGDLPGLVALTAGFVTRGPVVIGQRDARMFEAMRAAFAAEDGVAVIGFPHAPGVLQLFEQDGWTVTQVAV